MKKEKFLEYRADFLLITVAIAWGVTFLMVQEAIDSTPVYAFLFYRFALAAFLMFFIAWRFFKGTDFQTVFYGVLLGLFLFSAFATQTFGLLYTSSSIVAFITGLNVIFVPFLAFLIFKHVVRKNVLIGSVVAVIGLYLLTMSGEIRLAKGEFLTLLCAILFALHIVFTGKFSKEKNVYLLVFFQLVTVALLSLLFSLFLEAHTFSITFNYPFYKALIITAVFATVYAFLIQTYMQQFTTPSKTAVIFTIEPVSAAVYGYFAGGEILTPVQITGACLIIGATLIAEFKFQKRG